MLSHTQQYIISLDEVADIPHYDEMNQCFFFYKNGVKDAVSAIVQDSSVSDSGLITESKQVIRDLDEYISVEAEANIQPSNFDNVYGNIMIVTDVLADELRPLLHAKLGDVADRISSITPMPGPCLHYIVTVQK